MNIHIVTTKFMLLLPSDLQTIQHISKMYMKKYMHFPAVLHQRIYPSVSKDLLLKTIDHVKAFINISDDATKAIMHSRKSLLFSGTGVWIK